jgi:anti-sigma factor RsiW
VGSKMSDHLSQDLLEAYVIGALDVIEASDVERHVARCSACAVLLEREAALEVAFTAVVAMPKPSRLPRVRVGHLSAAAGAAVAMAAAVLLWLAPRSEHVQLSDEPSPTVYTAPESSGDASTFTASLDLQADGSRVGVRD